MSDSKHMNTFAELGVPLPLVDTLSSQGLVDTFPIQAATLPDSLAGRDVLGRGRTGSGKTLAFGLAMITRLADGTRPESKRPRSLILVPTRELANQVLAVVESKSTSVDVQGRSASSEHELGAQPVVFGSIKQLQSLRLPLT